MGRLIDREAESEALQQRLSGPSSLLLVYGQRRTGKTYLLQHLLQGRPNVCFFMADETSSKLMLERFVSALATDGLAPGVSGTSVGDWGSALALAVMGGRLKGGMLTLVLDEVQYLLAAEPALPSILQRIFDENREHLQLHIILCGSALGVLRSLGDADQPLFGRFSLRLKLAPFGFRAASLFAPEWTLVRQAELYAVLGGLARHLAELDPSESLETNVCRLVLAPMGPLAEAPSDLLRVERLSSRSDAASVLASLARGENRFNMIAARSGLSASRADYVLKELLELEMVTRETRFGDGAAARFSRYLCSDPFVSFYYQYVAPNRTAVLSSSPSEVWAQRVAPSLGVHVGRVFERIVAQSILSGALTRMFGPLDELAPFWSRDGQIEIDLVARFKRQRLFIECKWRPDSVVDKPVLDTLLRHVERSGLLTTEPWLPAIATAGRFSDQLMEMESRGQVVLMGTEQGKTAISSKFEVGSGKCM